MRLSTDYYPSHIEFYCYSCDQDNPETEVDSIDDDDVRMICRYCGEPTYVRVIF